MKKALLIFALNAISLRTYAQVGIGTSTPEGALDIVSTNNGVILPRLANTGAVSTAVNGMIIYDISSSCVKVYQNNAWTPCLDATSSSEVVIDCSENGFEGAFIDGYALSGASFTTSLTNNSFSTVVFEISTDNLVLSGTGVGSLTVASVSPTSVSLAAGQSQLVSYHLSGIPSAGTLIGAFSKLSLTCTNTKTVAGLEAALNQPNYCTESTINGAMVSGIPFSGNTFRLSFTNNTGSSISGLPAPATTDLALSYSGTGTFSVNSVSPAGTYTLANGASRTFTYTLSGTASSLGILTSNWAYEDLVCTKTKNIGYGEASFSLPATANIIAINDGAVDIAGLIDNASNQFIVNLNYTGGLGTYSSYTSAVVGNADGTAEGIDANGFSISYPSGTFSSSGYIPVTIIVDGDNSFNAKKQLFGAITNIASLDFQVNGISVGDFNIEVIGGIKDRNFTDPNHQFVYLPVTGAGGKTWLNNNLGAHYSNLNHASTSPSTQATNSADYNAYGSLFQWGRYSDGHELIDWTSSISSSNLEQFNVSSINSSATTVGHGNFILEFSAPNNWYTGINKDDLWQGVTGTNNPCPLGYRIPTEAELEAERLTWSPQNSAGALASPLQLTMAGSRDFSDGSLFSQNNYGRYWSSNVNLGHANCLIFYSDQSGLFVGGPRAYGFSVRYIKD